MQASSLLHGWVWMSAKRTRSLCLARSAAHNETRQGAHAKQKPGLPAAAVAAWLASCTLSDDARSFFGCTVSPPIQPAKCMAKNGLLRAA
jgi:hypothetical protein